MDDIKQAVILAGGKGTRMAPFTETNPKPMFLINDKPFLEILILQIKSFGITNILLLLGYLPEKIIDYFGDGSSLGVSLTYSISNVEDETGSRLIKAKESLSDRFLLMYCDNYCPIDFDKMCAQYNQSNALVQLTAYANRDSYTKSNLTINNDGLVEIYDKNRTSENLSFVDIGYILVNKMALDYLPSENVNFEAYVYPKLVEIKQLFAYKTEHSYYSIGSFSRIELTKEFFLPKKVVLLDRDGTLNKKAPKACYITTPEEFIWLDGAIDAIKKLNDSGFLVLLVTNQPGISRGIMTSLDLDNIHNKMHRDLSENGAKIDQIYFCPHGWDDGCFCRKPSPGMLFEAQREFSFNLTEAVFIGDDPRDMQAASFAGCRGILVNNDVSLYRVVSDLIKS